MMSKTAAGRLHTKKVAQMMTTVLFMSDSCLLRLLYLSILGLSRVSLLVSSHMEMSSSDILRPGTDRELVKIGCFVNENIDAEIKINFSITHINILTPFIEGCFHHFAHPPISFCQTISTGQGMFKNLVS